MSKSNEEERGGFRFSMMLSVLDHLSEGLYSNVAAVLTEAVANAWDADATDVHIDVLAGTDRCENVNGADRIVVQDNGHGMAEEDVQGRYLAVGYRRRQEEGDHTLGGRPVMGRKGLGKLSLFAVADELVVETLKEGEEPVAFRIDVAELRNKVKKRESVENHLIPRLRPENVKRLRPHGTRVELRQLRQDRLRGTGTKTLRRMIARRFAVIGSHDFRVYVNGTEVTVDDRESLKDAEYLWVFGKYPPKLPEGTEVKENFHVFDRAEGWPKDWCVKGWVATSEKPQRRVEGADLNSIVVLARGRVAADNILPAIQGAQHFYRYVTGQIEADFLDRSDEDEVITSDRQRLREEDPRVQQLYEFLKNALAEMEREWKERRGKERSKGLFDRYPKLSEWLNDLPCGWRQKAKSLLERILTMPDDEGGPVHDRELLRAALFGFERLRLRGDAEELEQAINDVDPLKVLKLLGQRDDLEVAVYRDIVKERLRAIEELSRITREDQRERVLQEYLFDHLWLLDPAWDRVTADEEMEKKLKLEEEFRDDQSVREKYGRVDIKYRRVGAGNVLVELKRYSVNPKPAELADQCEKYVKALKRGSDEPWTIVVVVGKMSPEARSTAESYLQIHAPGSKVRTYDDLIARARASYNQFIEGSKKVDRIERLFEVDEERDGSEA